MSYVLTKVICLGGTPPYCNSANVKKSGVPPNGIKSTGKQNFYCKACHRQFQQTYTYQGANPLLKKQVCEMSMCVSGIRAIAKVLKMSAVTVIAILRLWFKTHQEPTFEGIFEEVIIDEMWSWVGKRKTGKRWIWYAQCATSGKILAFQIGKRNDKTCKKLMKKLEHLTIQKYCTDDWTSYKKYIPSEKHIISKTKTQKIERQNLNFRTHSKRLCRKTICFSKKDEMHYGFVKAYSWRKNAA
jgi:insertion element IS1 protein InsB